MMFWSIIGVILALAYIVYCIKEDVEQEKKYENWESDVESAWAKMKNDERKGE